MPDNDSKETETIGEKVEDVVDSFLHRDRGGSGVDPTPASSETPSADSASESPTLDEAPDPAFGGQVLPTDAPSDTREVQAMKAAGTLPGLTDSALSALDELEKAHDQMAAWVTYAKSLIKKVRAL